MYYLILAMDDKRIVHVSGDLAYQDNGNYLINGGAIAIPPSICELAEVESVPDGVEPEKWCYVNGEFVPNPNWVEPVDPSDIDFDRVFAILEGVIE